MAAAWVNIAGWSNALSPGCTNIDDCAFVLNAILIFVVVALAVLAWHLYRYADKLVSADPAYR